MYTLPSLRMLHCFKHITSVLHGGSSGEGGTSVYVKGFCSMPWKVVNWIAVRMLPKTLENHYTLLCMVMDTHTHNSV